MQIKPLSDNVQLVLYLLTLSVLLGLIFYFLAPAANRADELSRQRIHLIMQATNDDLRNLNADPILPRESVSRGSETPSWTIEEYIRMRARGYNLDEDLTVVIAECEGGVLNGKQRKNPNSTAYSVFQLLDGTLASVSKHDNRDYKRGNLIDEIDAGVSLMAWQGTTPFNASRSCWE